MSGSVSPAAPAAPAAAAPEAAPPAAAPVAVEAPPVAEPVKPAEAAPVAPVVPEKYEFKLPAGVTMDAALVEKATPLLRELGLSNEAANKLVALQLQHQDAQAAEYTARTSKAWLEEIQADKDFGGEKLEATHRASNAFLNQFDTDHSVAKLLQEFGIGNHPGLIRMMARAAAHFAQDTFHGSTGVPSVSEEEAQHRKMYPSMFKDSKE
jgi:hypothetical protein